MRSRSCSRQLTKTPLMAKIRPLYAVRPLAAFTGRACSSWAIRKAGRRRSGAMPCPSDPLLPVPGASSPTGPALTLPCAIVEISTLFRNESSGEMDSLTYLRQFTISEGHLICTPEHRGGRSSGPARAGHLYAAMRGPVRGRFLPLFPMGSP